MFFWRKWQKKTGSKGEQVCFLYWMSADIKSNNYKSDIIKSWFSSLRPKLLTEEDYPPLNIKAPPQQFLSVTQNTSSLYESNAVEQQHMLKMVSN